MGDLVAWKASGGNSLRVVSGSPMSAICSNFLSPSKDRFGSHQLKPERRRSEVLVSSVRFSFPLPRRDRLQLNMRRQALNRGAGAGNNQAPALSRLDRD
jgi:hypothetical protein